MSSRAKANAYGIAFEGNGLIHPVRWLQITRKYTSTSVADAPSSAALASALGVNLNQTLARPAIL